VIRKAKFWEIHASRSLNERQKSMINRMLDGIEGKLTSSKWAKMAKTSQDTDLYKGSESPLGFPRKMASRLAARQGCTPWGCGRPGFSPVFLFY